MGVLELKIIECGNTSLDYELALSGHPDRIATSGQRTTVAPCFSSMPARSSISRVSGTTIRRPAVASL